MPSSNFLYWDETGYGSNMLSDSEYNANSQRINGLPDGKANPAVHNKLFRQASIMVAAIGQFIVNAGFDASDVSLAALVTNLTNALKSTGAQTGDGKDSWALVPPSGWIFAMGTIGAPGSNATNRANNDAQALYNFFWTNITTSQMFTSTGQAATRGISALADWQANKQLAVPDVRGRVRVALDNMNGVAAGRITSGPSAGQASCTTLGATGGEQTHVQTLAELKDHAHDIGALGSSFSAGSNRSGYYPPNGTQQVGTTGGGQPFNVCQPWVGCNYIFKL